MDLSYIRDHWNNTINADVPASIAAWDSVAEDYVYDAAINFYDNDFLRLLLEKIPLDKNMSVLDIGCGAGAFGLALAEKVGSVVGTDFSPKMLDAGRHLAAEQNVPNIEFVERNWWSCDGAEFRGKYDLVFAHTTPAVADYASFVKMTEASRRYCALCKPARRTDEVTDAIRDMVGQKRNNSDDSVAYAFDTAWLMGCSPRLYYQKTVWNSRMPLEEAEIWYVNRLKGSCRLTPSDEKKICQYLADISEEGFVHEAIHTTLVTMIWDAPQ